MNEDNKNPHDIIQLIGKPKRWRMKASIILIKLWEDNERQKLKLNGVLALCILILTAIIGLVFK